MRYQEEMVNKKASEGEEGILWSKQGRKDYDYNNLGGAKKIPTKGGYK